MHACMCMHARRYGHTARSRVGLTALGEKESQNGIKSQLAAPAEASRNSEMISESFSVNVYRDAPSNTEPVKYSTLQAERPHDSVQRLNSCAASTRKRTSAER